MASLGYCADSSTNQFGGWMDCHWNYCESATKKRGRITAITRSSSRCRGDYPDCCSAIFANGWSYEVLSNKYHILFCVLGQFPTMALTVYCSIQYHTSMTVKHLGVTLRTDLLKI